jgi:hypothetical protein
MTMESILIDNHNTVWLSVFSSCTVSGGVCATQTAQGIQRVAHNGQAMPISHGFNLRIYGKAVVLVSFLALFCSSCKQTQTPTGPDRRRADMDAYCNERGKEDLSDGQKLSRVEAFYSWKLHTCVQAEVNNDSDWSYDLRDVSAGFFRGSETVKSEVPLSVYHYDYHSFRTISAEGFWVSTDTSKDKQLVQQIAAKIDCNSSEKTCTEHDAELFGGLLQPESESYQVTRWDDAGVVADDEEGGNCSLGHRLAIDFASNSVVVTDYPLKAGGGTDCRAFQNANSYSLHGGSIGIMSENGIFSCTKDGVNSAIITKVKEFHGHVADKNYSLWLDNGEGGPPATLKTPAHPYSQADCRRLMDKKMAELKAE